MNHKPLSYSLLIILCFFKSADASDSALLVENAWIAEAPPVSKVMVAYMTLSNPGDELIEIIAAESDNYSSIEFHETVHEDGLAKMMRHDSLKILPKKSLQLKRGGQHLMLFNPTKRLKAGDIVTIQLMMKNDIYQTVSIPVKKAQF
jgi:copper(I)-binding protein